MQFKKGNILTFIWKKDEEKENDKLDIGIWIGNGMRIVWISVFGYENCKFYAVSLVQYIHTYIFLLNICRSQLSLAIEVQLSKFVKNFENSILWRFLRPLLNHRSIYSENLKFLDVKFLNVFSKKSITSLFVILEFLYSSFDPCEHIFLVSWKELLNVTSNGKKIFEIEMSIKMQIIHVY